MGTLRRMTDDERALLTALVLSVPRADHLLVSLEDVLVEEMADGGMGSLRFRYLDGRTQHLGELLVEKEFVDVDGVPVVATINLDEVGRLYELDIWKVDFSPLISLPRPTSK